MSEVSRKNYENYKILQKSGFDYQAVLKENKISQRDVDELRKISITSRHIPKATPDSLFLLCLVTCNNDLDRSANMLGKYCQIFQETPEWFMNRDMTLKEVKNTFDHHYIFTLPPIPEKNYNVLYHALNSYDTKHFNFDESERAIMMTVGANLFTNGPRNGYVFLYDMKGSKLGHAMKPKLKSLTKMMKYINECSLIKIKEVHILNTSSFVNIMMSVLRPMMSERFFKRIYFHYGNIDYQKFYAEFIPKACLPREYGGDLESVEELHNKHRTFLTKMKTQFALEENMFAFKFDKFVGEDSDEEEFANKV